MKDTHSQHEAGALIARARSQLVEDMQSRGIAAIIWNLATAGFHYVPEIVTGQDKEGRDVVERVTGLYAVKGALYAIEESEYGSVLDEFYDRQTDVAPTVVTLTESMARAELGDPAEAKGFTKAGSNAEWLVIADCYFEALNER